MNLDKYQKRAAEFDLFGTTTDLKSPGFIEKVLGLVGEAGEAADKIKKIIVRNMLKIHRYRNDSKNGKAEKKNPLQHLIPR